MEMVLEIKIIRLTIKIYQKNKYMENKMNRSPDMNEGGGNNNETQNKNLEILNTFIFVNYDESKAFEDSFKKNVIENSNLQGLEKTAFIAIETELVRHSGNSNFPGVEIAENLLRDNKADHVFMYAFQDLEAIRKNTPEIDLLLAKENVKFLEAPFMPQQVIEALRSDVKEVVSSKKLQEVQDKKIDYKVAILLHKIHINSPDQLDNLPTDDSSRIPEMIAESKKYFPALEGKSDKEIVEFLFEIRKNVPEIMKGQNIEGVYCDIEGTLFNGEELNTKTLDMLKEFEAQGKNITLWTDGDITKLQMLLDKAEIKYPLKSKIDHAGASAEIVIDNEDNNTFSAKTKIYAKKFIKI
jgi:hypothetical protein